MSLTLLRHRRALLLAAGAAASCWLPGCASVAPPPRAEASAGGDGDVTEAAAAVSGFRIPADFEPQAAVWLGWDAGHEAFTAALVAALQPHVSLKMLVRDEAALAAARSALARRGLRSDGLRFFVEPLAMYFMRDAAVFSASPQDGLGVVDLRWTQYGLPAWCSRRHDADPRAVARCAAGVESARDGLDRRLARRLGARIFTSTLAMEGGGIESNGQGTLVANESLFRQRNPGEDIVSLDAALRRLPGVRQVIWLPEGLAQDPLHRGTITGPYVGWGTGGHTDEFVRFADAATVLLAWPEDAEASHHPVARLNRQRMQRNLDVLSRASNADGQPLRVVKVPLPRIVERRVFLSAAADVEWSREWTADFFPAAERRRQGDMLMQVASASYLNFVVSNGVVVLPDYRAHGTPRALQQRVQGLFEGVFPGRQVRFVDAIGANWVGGGAHCATLAEPWPGPAPA